MVIQNLHCFQHYSWLFHSWDVFPFTRQMGSQEKIAVSKIASSSSFVGEKMTMKAKIRSKLHVSIIIFLPGGPYRNNQFFRFLSIWLWMPRGLIYKKSNFRSQVCFRMLICMEQKTFSLFFIKIENDLLYSWKVSECLLAMTRHSDGGLWQ